MADSKVLSSSTVGKQPVNHWVMFAGAWSLSRLLQDNIQPCLGLDRALGLEAESRPHSDPDPEHHILYDLFRVAHSTHHDE